jgi:hypothetical protein
MVDDRYKANRVWKQRRKQKMTKQAQTNEADETKMRGHHTLTKLPPPPREIGVVNINGENLKNNSNT